MPQHHNIELPSYEARLTLAIQALEKDAFLSERRAAAIYNVPRTSLQKRRAGSTPKRDYTPVARKLTKLEEEAIVRYILELDLRGLAPTRVMVRDMADRLLRERDAVVH